MRPVSLVLVLLVAVLTAGCANTPPTITPAPTAAAAADAPTADPNARPLTVEVLNQDHVVGFERVAFRLLDETGTPVPSGGEVEVSFNRVSDIAPGQTLSQPVASGKAVYFGAGLPGGGAWVVYHDFDSSGPWSFDVSMTGPDGTHSTGKGSLELQGRSTVPAAGDRPPAEDTPKLSEGGALADLTSDPDPDERLYQRSVADVIQARRPAVVFFGSPQHCPTPSCATTLAEVKKVMGSLGSQVDFLHVESRDLTDPTRLSSAAQAWGLTTEPWTFILNARGGIAARVEGEIDSQELELLVKNMTGLSGGQ